jgi:SAM-dependent methyltransferase
MRESPPEVNARAHRSLRRRGLRATLHSACRRVTIFCSRLVDLHFDPAFGTETRRMVERDDMRDVSSANLPRGIRYEPTRALPFRRALRAARVPTGAGFVDLGCGKGRVLVLAVLSGFPRVTGVDYSPELCAAAERNLAVIRSRTGRAFTSHVLHMDAADYTFARQDTVVYLYHPFDASVLGAVVARLRRSLVQHPRDLWIVYHNPVGREVIEGGGGFALVGDYSFGGCAFAVYRSAKEGGRGPHGSSAHAPRAPSQ